MKILLQAPVAECEGALGELQDTFLLGAAEKKV